jgi:hypothetical protein
MAAAAAPRESCSVERVQPSTEALVGRLLAEDDRPLGVDA